MSIYGNASGGQATVLQSNNADKLDNKDSTEFAAASDVSKLGTLVGDVSVSEQISTATTNMLTIDITAAEEGTANLINADTLCGLQPSALSVSNASTVGGKNVDYFAKAESVPFNFGVDNNGNYGYIKAGADSVTPFRKIDLLWELASGTTTFEAQTISLDLSKYKQVLIEFGGSCSQYVGTPYPCYACLPVPMESANICTGGGTRTSDSKSWVYYSNVTIATDGITFSANYYRGASSGSQNSTGFPMRIYGLYFADLADSSTYDK